MKRSFAVRRDATKLFERPAQRGAGACASCGAGALTRSEKRQYLGYGFFGSVIVGAVGFAAGNSAVATAGLLGLGFSVLGLGVVGQMEDDQKQEQA
jgi:hypothetical protein